MRILLDTQALLWWLGGNLRLPRAVRTLIDDSTTEVLVSAATVFEIVTKVRIGKLDIDSDVAVDVPAYVRRQGFVTLDITAAHAQRAGSMRGHHRDPFDRMLIAQALADDLTLVSNEALFDSFGVRRLW